MATGAVIARILTQYSDKGSKAAQKDIQKLGKNIDAFGKKATKAFGLAAAATVALSIKLGTDAVKAAIEDSKSQLTLSNALKVTTGATDSAIAAVEDYITKQQMLTNVQDTELRSSLQSLVVATGDVTEAQRLQTIALDVAAATGKDLRTVTIAMVRAQQGNVNSLKKLSPELSGLIKKTTKAEDIFSLLGATYEGSARKLAKQDPITNMQLAFGELAEEIGKALLPAVTYLTNYMVTDLIPTFTEFVRLNQAEITKNVIGLAKAIESLVKNGSGIASFLIQWRGLISFIVGTLATIYTMARSILLLSAALGILKKTGILKINIGITKNSLTAMKEMGGLSRVYAFIVKNYRKVVVGISAITAAFRAQGIAAGIAAIATAFATGGASIAAASATIATFGIVALGGVSVYNALTKSSEKAAASTDKVTRSTERAGMALDYQWRMYRELEAQRKKNAAADAAAEAARIKAEKAAAAAAKKKADIEAKTAAVKKRIEAATGLKITDADEYELIQLTAVEKLQLKQKEADSSLAERIKLRKEELAVFNSLTAKTEQYLDFLKAINTDGKLDDSEIVKLMSKWGLTKQEAQKYADFVYAIGDRKLSNTEIDNLKSKWGLTTKEVVDYIAKIGAPVDAKGTILSAGDIAALGWKNAASALDAYNAKLGKTPQAVPPPPPSNPELPTLDPAEIGRYFGGVGPMPVPKLQTLPTPSYVQDLIDREMAFDAPYMPSYGSFTGSNTLNGGMSLSSNPGSVFGANQNIYVNVSGSVTTEQDLVQSIRQGLLQGQSSGYSLLLQEI